MSCFFAFLMFSLQVKTPSWRCSWMTVKWNVLPISFLKPFFHSVACSVFLTPFFEENNVYDYYCVNWESASNANGNLLKMLNNLKQIQIVLSLVNNFLYKKCINPFLAAIVGGMLWKCERLSLAESHVQHVCQQIHGGQTHHVQFIYY